MDASGNMTVAGTVSGGTPTGGMRNKLINGGFDIWQRGTSFSNWSSFSYLVDRWRIGYDGTPANGRTLTRQSFALGQTDILDGDPTYYMEYTFPNCGTPSNYIRQDIEGVRTLAGKRATFSFWARTTTGTMSISAFIAQEFGTGGSPSAGVYPAATSYTATTTWQKFVFTTTMPSISGKTLGTNGDDRMWPAVLFPPNVAGTIQLANMQLEEGSIATPFEKRPIGTELALCQRYYELLGPGGVGSSTTNLSSQNIGWNFKVTKRVTPTVTHLSNYSLIVSGQTTHTATATSIDRITTTGLTALVAISTGPNATGLAMCYYTNSDNVAVSAEL
jgi:hypothetical protein